MDQALLGMITTFGGFMQPFYNNLVLIRETSRWVLQNETLKILYIYISDY